MNGNVEKEHLGASSVRNDYIEVGYSSMSGKINFKVFYSEDHVHPTSNHTPLLLANH